MEFDAIYASYEDGIDTTGQDEGKPRKRSMYNFKHFFVSAFI